MKKLEIFKIGCFTPMGGSPVYFTETDLRAMAAAYDPSLLKAPLVVGHPTLEAPAYGYVKSLLYENQKLLAEPDRVDPSFADLVNAGRYLSLSASFYRPYALNNPRPGSYYLRHVGFLGATAPAVKGLETPSFCEEGYNVIQFSEIISGAIPRDITLYV
jgi:hypothetical protein